MACRDEERRQRAEARKRTAVVHRTSLSPVERDLTPVRGAAAVSLVGALTRASWSLAGRPFPEYQRSEIPVRFVPRRSS